MPCYDTILFLSSPCKECDGIKGDSDGLANERIVVGLINTREPTDLVSLQGTLADKHCTGPC